MPAMVFASHARNPCELRESSMPAEAPREQRVCTRSAPACGEQAGRPLLLPKLANARRMDAGDTFAEYREMTKRKVLDPSARNAGRMTTRAADRASASSETGVA